MTPERFEKRCENEDSRSLNDVVYMQLLAAIKQWRRLGNYNTYQSTRKARVIRSTVETGDPPAGYPKQSDRRLLVGWKPRGVD